MTKRPMSPFYDLAFATGNTICECGYVKGPHTFTHNASGYSNHKCHCPTCTQGHREYNRRKGGYQPSHFIDEVDRLTAELEELREENAMLCARLQDLEDR